MTTPSLVQSKLGPYGTGVGVTLDSAPTPGNYLLLWKSQHNDVAPTVQSGFTDLSGDVENTIGNDRHGRLMYRIVQGGDAASIASVDSQGGNQYGIQEWTGVSSLGDLAIAASQGSSTPFLCGGYVTPGSVPATVVGFATIFQGSNEPTPTSITPTAFTTEIFDTANGSIHDVMWSGYRVLAVPSGDYAIGGTVGAGDGRPISYAGVTIVLVGSGSPVADFTADVFAGDAPITIQFEDLSTNTPTSWLWDFGDGSTSTSQDPAHTYTVPGTYAVSLTATNAEGSDTETKTAYVTIFEDVGYVEPEPAGALLEIYAASPGSSRWGIALWGQGRWASAGWQDVTPQGIDVRISWGSREPELGILSRPEAETWQVNMYDPERILDPANEDSPYHADLVPFLPLRLSHRGVIIRTGYAESIGYGYKDSRGLIRGTGNQSRLANSDIPEDSTLSDTLRARARDVISVAGLRVQVEPDPPSGDPAVAPRLEGSFSAWKHIQDAAEQVHHIPYIDRNGRLGFRAWANPLVRARSLASDELIDLLDIMDYKGLYSVVRALETVADGGLVVERRLTPTPPYGPRVYERRDPTIDADTWAETVLAERAWPTIRWVPGDMRPLDANGVEALATIEAIEQVSILYTEADPPVIAGAIVVGGEITVIGKRDESATWGFRFEAAAAPTEPLIETGGDPTDYLSATGGAEFLYPTS